MWGCRAPHQPCWVAASIVSGITDGRFFSQSQFIICIRIDTLTMTHSYTCVQCASTVPNSPTTRECMHGPEASLMHGAVHSRQSIANWLGVAQGGPLACSAWRRMRLGCLIKAGWEMSTRKKPPFSSSHMMQRLPSFKQKSSICTPTPHHRFESLMWCEPFNRQSPLGNSKGYGHSAYATLYCTL